MGDAPGVREVRASSAYGSRKQSRRLRVQNARRTFGHCVGGKGPRALADRVGGKEIGALLVGENICRTQCRVYGHGVVSVVCAAEALGACAGDAKSL